MQFKDISNQRKSEAWSHSLYNNAQPTPECNLCSVIQKEVVQAPKAWSNIWNQSTESMWPMIVKTTKLFRLRKRSYHKLWKRKWVLLRLQRRGQITLKTVPCLNYNQAQISGTREGFFSHCTICHKTQKQTEWWKCALIVMRQYYKHQWQTAFNLINASLINCAETNSNNFTMILSFYRSKLHYISKPEKNGFSHVFFSANRSPGFKVLPPIGNTSCYCCKPQDQQFAFCGRFRTACILWTERSA